MYERLTNNRWVTRLRYTVRFERLWFPLLPLPSLPHFTLLTVSWLSASLSKQSVDESAVEGRYCFEIQCVSLQLDAHKQALEHRHVPSRCVLSCGFRISHIQLTNNLWQTYISLNLRWNGVPIWGNRLATRDFVYDCYLGKERSQQLTTCTMGRQQCLALQVKKNEDPSWLVIMLSDGPLYLSTFFHLRNASSLFPIGNHISGLLPDRINQASASCWYVTRVNRFA